jgi:DNA-binding MarR family transcriptional regulator
MAAFVALPVGEGIDFVSLKRLTGLTDGNLSSHLSMLEQVRYVSIDKCFEGKKPKTRIWVTSKGREAFSRYVEELERILKSSMG